MMPYLFSFIDARSRFHSHVLVMAAPGDLTGAALNDTIAALKLDYGLDSITVMGACPLPGKADHPGAADGRYAYHVGFHIVMAAGSGFGTAEIVREDPIVSVRTLRHAEEDLRSAEGVQQITITTCLPLAAPRPELGVDFAEMRDARDAGGST